MYSITIAFIQLMLKYYNINWDTFPNNKILFYETRERNLLVFLITLFNVTFNSQSILFNSRVYTIRLWYPYFINFNKCKKITTLKNHFFMKVYFSRETEVVNQFYEICWLETQHLHGCTQIGSDEISAIDN